ncbi:MAG: hypothetical protein KJ064_27830 [Anaerolineae bacterium]|nr:hypothetical protein [Anaerolineae bacterium]
MTLEQAFAQFLTSVAPQMGLGAVFLWLYWREREFSRQQNRQVLLIMENLLGLMAQVMIKGKFDTEFLAKTKDIIPEEAGS